MAEWISNVHLYLILTTKQLSRPFMVCAGTGLILMILRRTRIAFLLIGALIVNLAVTLLNRNFNANPDTGPAYLMLSTTILMVGAGYLLFYLWEMINRWKARYLWPLLLIIPAIYGLVWGVSNSQRNSLSRDESAGMVGRSVLDVCEPDAALFYGMYHNLPFVINYLQYVEFYREDIIPVNRSELVYWPGGLENLMERYPVLTAGIFKGPYGDSLRYLAPRSSRHSGTIPYSTARDLLFNATAWMAQEYSVQGASYWFSSEDDHLLRVPFVCRGPMFKLGVSDGNRSGGDVPIDIADQHMVRRTRSAENRGFAQTKGAEVLATFYDLQCITLVDRNKQNKAIRAFTLSEHIDPALGRICEPVKK